jgi:hypothetical protein
MLHRGIFGSNFIRCSLYRWMECLNEFGLCLITGLSTDLEQGAVHKVKCV